MNPTHPYSRVSIPALSAAVWLVAASATMAGEFHVSPRGHDANPGTADRPFATFTAARDAVRQWLANSADGDVIVHVRGGIYRVTEPIAFGPEDGGNEHRSVTWAAHGDEQPLLSGGKSITNWVANRDGTWSAKIPQVGDAPWRFRELFVNGQRRPRARHPNEGYARVVAAGADKRTTFSFNPADIPTAVTPDGLELVFLHDWSITRVAVKAIDRQSNVLTVRDPIGCDAPHYRIDHFEPNPRYFLENHPSLLDAAGEWFADEQRGIVTYKPMAGESIEQVEAVAPLAEGVIVVRGEAGRPVRRLRFRGLHVAHCRWDIPPGGYAEGQAAFHEPRGREDAAGHFLRGFMPAAVQFELAEDCRFELGSVRHVGGTGVWFGRQCRGNALVGSVIADVAGNGVMIGEDTSRQVEGRPWWTAAPDQAATGNAIENCLIERVGQLYYGAVGVWVGLANHTRIAHNEIRHTPYTGISIGWRWDPTPTPCHHNVVEYNHIHHVMQTLSDGGGIYTLGRQPGTILRGQHIHDVPVNLGRAESNGMFLDEGTTEILIEGNVIHHTARSPLRFHRAQKNVVRGNVLVLPADTPVVRYNSTDEAHIELIDNQTPSASDWDLKSAQSMIDKAGIEPEYRRSNTTGR